MASGLNACGWPLRYTRLPSEATLSAGLTWSCLVLLGPAWSRLVPPLVPPLAPALAPMPPLAPPLALPVQNVLLQPGLSRSVSLVPPLGLSRSVSLVPPLGPPP